MQARATHGDMNNRVGFSLTTRRVLSQPCCKDGTQRGAQLTPATQPADGEASFERQVCPRPKAEPLPPATGLGVSRFVFGQLFSNSAAPAKEGTSPDSTGLGPQTAFLTASQVGPTDTVHLRSHLSRTSVEASANPRI